MRNEEVRLGAEPERSTRGERTGLHPVLGTAFDALSLAGVRWCLMRLPSSLSAPTGDIDLLVDRTDYARTGRILRALGFGTLRCGDEVPIRKRFTSAITRRPVATCASTLPRSFLSAPATP